MTSIISPLRYPGSKRRLARYIDETLKVNKLHPALFVEPFAGGASVALQLLNDGAVQRIGLIEKDPLVAAFWQIVFSSDDNDVEWLIEQVRKVEITVEKWRELKGHVPEDKRDRAFACLFLNRTSFSGILAPSSGPLGGQGQNTPYKIDCRFPREKLVRRIKQAAMLRDRVAFVWEADWTIGLQRVTTKQKDGELSQDAFFYFDPPFFKKAERLYNYYFTDDDHITLRDSLLKTEKHWVLSYDYCEKVGKLYQESAQTHIEVLYSAAQNGGSRVVTEVLLSNLSHFPIPTKLWKTDTEWKKAKANGHH